MPALPERSWPGGGQRQGARAKPGASARASQYASFRGPWWCPALVAATGPNPNWCSALVAAMGPRWCDPAEATLGASRFQAPEVTLAPGSTWHLPGDCARQDHGRRCALSRVHGSMVVLDTKRLAQPGRGPRFREERSARAKLWAARKASGCHGSKVVSGMALAAAAHRHGTIDPRCLLGAGRGYC